MRATSGESVCSQSRELELTSQAKSKGDNVSDSTIQKLSLGRVAPDALRGSIAGLLGGIVFAVWMAENGMFPVIASMVGGNSSLLGLLMHLGISAKIGAIFSVLFGRLARGMVPSLLWGVVNGFAWWFLGPLTLMPLLLGLGLQWTAIAVAGSLASLTWHLVFGGVMGIAYAALTDHGLLASESQRGSPTDYTVAEAA